MNESKKIEFNVEARERLRSGVNQLADAVKVTLGAKGKNVIIEQSYNLPQITKDGVTVARSIILEDAIENMAAQLIKSVAQRTNELAGDGTTTATVLAQSIFNNGLKAINSGANPMDIKRGIDLAVKLVVKKLKELSLTIGDDFKILENIATISANNDIIIGKNISGAIKSVTTDGIITIAESTGTETTINVVEGMQYDKGFLSPYFATDLIKIETVFENPLILMYSGAINTIPTLMRALELSNEQNRPLLIIADDVSVDVLNLLIMNKIKGALRVCAAKAPSFGQSRKDMLEDLSVLTNGLVMKADIGLPLHEITIDQMGQAQKVVVNENSTTIIGGKGVPKEIELQIEKIKYQIENAPSEYDKERFRERLSKLSGGVAVINVGGSSEVDIKEKKDRFEDALNATRAAIEEGFVPGGGIAFMNCVEILAHSKGRNEDETEGIEIVAKAIEEPFRQILKNAGVSHEVVFSKLIEHKFGWGFNVYSDKYEDFLKTGIIDPTKVARVALENAASISSLLLTTDCVIVDKEKPKQGGN